MNYIIALFEDGFIHGNDFMLIENGVDDYSGSLEERIFILGKQCKLFLYLVQGWRVYRKPSTDQTASLARLQIPANSFSTDSSKGSGLWVARMSSTLLLTVATSGSLP